MKITTLVENTSVAPHLECEHGLSLYIEVFGKKILFDMGQGSLFAENAKLLGIDLALVDYAIVSHGHYDHGGGLAHFLKLNQKAKVFLQEGAFVPHQNNFGKEIGLDSALKENSRLVFVKDYTKIADGLEIFSCNEKPPFQKKLTSGSILADSFDHEIYLKITEKKQVAVSGCSHKGVLNILHWLKPNIFVGGFHFKDIDCVSSAAELNYLAKEIAACGDFCTKLYTCHCTGVPQFEVIKKILGDTLQYLATGSVIVV